jgi:hypothetical protein
LAHTVRLAPLLLLELIVLRLLLKPGETPHGRLAGAFVAANLATYPPTCLLAACIGQFAETLPMLAEPFLFSRLLHLPLRRVAGPVILANLVSWLAGLWITSPWSPI